ncbi:DUF3710 domain-containing protein [Arthrobacter sulfonylureivorans]|uniref:DUF3710 domain-containing protein n=1 Tax=Arthrobacter sulfonylureivorans TaxID=2486855 RepID=UPI0039E31A42
MAFGRSKKKNQNDGGEPATEASALSEETTQQAPESGPRRNGPFDDSEQDAGTDYLDLGALKIRPREGLQLRLEIEEKSQRVVAVTLDFGGSNLQLQAFAAPKSEGLWDEIRTQIASSVGSQGGTVQEFEGPMGTEVVAKLPAQTSDGQKGYRVARFLGIDGPRWFLRGVIGGPAALDRAKAADLEELFRSTIVVRGTQPLPPKDLLQLKMPKGAAEQQAAAPQPGLSVPERGPEITEIR